MLVVLFSLVLSCFVSAFGGSQMMSVSQMSMMTGHFVGTSLMLLRSLPMVTGGVLVMFGGSFVMLRAFVLGHLFLSLPQFCDYR
jgi:hypothetical protein